MFAWYGRIAALAVVAVFGSGCVSSTRPHSPSPFHLQLAFRLPAGASSWDLCWAGGLVCVPYERLPWVFVDPQRGKMRMLRIPFDGSPMSIQCDSPRVYAQLRESLSVVDLINGKSESLISSNKAFWLTQVFYYPGCFWRSDHKRFLAMSFRERHASNTLVLFGSSSQATAEWRVPAGKIRSWTWGMACSSNPRVLTVKPGRLYDVSDGSENWRSVPALDRADAAILSPECDRAVGFGRGRCGMFLVDFCRPDVKVTIKADTGKDLGKGVVEWALWSPDGKLLAVFHRAAESPHLALYVGDPSKPMHRVVPPEGYRFPNRAVFGHPIVDRTFVWAQGGKELFCLLVDEGRSHKNHPRFAIGRINIGISAFGD